MSRREELINKIAFTLYPEGQVEKLTNDAVQKKTAQPDSDKLFEKCASASVMLKTAAQEIRSLKSKNEKLASNVSELTERLHSIEKHDEAEKLAQTMVRKGMLKAGDVDGKTIELMALDNEGFSIVKDAIENVNIEKNASHLGVDSFDFMYDIDSSDYMMEDESKPSMVDAIKGCIK